jgi:hypothetical protein
MYQQTFLCNVLFSLFTSLTLLAYFFLGCSKDETVIAYLFAADGATVEFHSGFQIGVFIGYLPFIPPNQLPGFLMLYGGEAARFKRNGRASPCFAADIAKEAETERFPVGMVGCPFGNRCAHICKINTVFRFVYL